MDRGPAVRRQRWRYESYVALAQPGCFGDRRVRVRDRRRRGTDAAAVAPWAAVRAQEPGGSAQARAAQPGGSADQSGTAARLRDDAGLQALLRARKGHADARRA